MTIPEITEAQWRQHFTGLAIRYAEAEKAVGDVEAELAAFHQRRRSLINQIRILESARPYTSVYGEAHE